MTRKRLLMVFIPLFVVGMYSGCADPAKLQQPVSDLMVMEVQYTGCPVVIDGKLDDVIWQTSQVYNTSLSQDKQMNGDSLRENAKIQLAWDELNLYVAIDVEDSDIVAEGTEDGLRHARFGDMAEVFLKPVGKSWFWELIVTPRGNKSTFFFPSEGRMSLPGCFEYKFAQSPFCVSAKIKGTLNNYNDRDTGWIAEMSIPIRELTIYGDKFGPDAKWKICVGRYNYSYYFSKGKESSMFPALPFSDFYSSDNYADLILKY